MESRGSSASPSAPKLSALLASLAEARQDGEDALQQVHELKMRLDAARTAANNQDEEIANLKADLADVVRYILTFQHLYLITTERFGTDGKIRISVKHDEVFYFFKH